MDVKHVKSQLIFCQSTLHWLKEYPAFDEQDTLIQRVEQEINSIKEKLNNRKLDLTSPKGDLLKRIVELEDLLFASGQMNEPPCFCCGYKGEGYFNSEKHSCATRHHKLFYGD